VSDLVFDALSGGCVALLFWQVTRLELATWRSGDVAPTSLMTPLWIPQLPMAIGFGILCLTFVRTLWRDVSRLRAAFGRAAR
jgi:TRAP-type C4-dicarboxylate transport system permease small subunit